MEHRNFISYQYEEHLIRRQNLAEAEFLAAFEKESPCIENATILVNPYFINPLSALLLFKTEKKLAVKLTVHGKRFKREDIVHTFTENTSHIIPIIGLYSDCKTRVTIELSDGTIKEFTIQADILPKEGVATCQNIMTSLDYFGTDIMILSPAGKNFPVGYDYRGEIRWLLNVNTMFDIKRLKNGNLLTESYRYSRMPYCSTGLLELTMTGKIIKEYRMPGNAHHDEVELEDGNIMALTQDYSAGSSTVEDMIALLDRKTGMVLRTWDFKDFLPQDCAGSGSQDAHDWFHNNALWVDEKKKTITLSGRHQDAIVNFSYEENNGKGKLNWIIGDPEGWPEDMQKYFFKPVGDTENFDWQYEQHACILLENGDVMVFDNGQFRAKAKENYIKNRDNFSRGVRYRIDTEKMEIEQIWQFGKEWGQDFFSPYICNVEYYDEGHYMIHSGGIGYWDGYAPDGLPPRMKVDAQSVPGSYFELRSKTVEEKNGVIMYYLELDENFYRAERLSLYHEKDNQPLGKGELIGELDITPEFDTIPEIEETTDLIPLDLSVHILQEEDKFILSGSFKRGSLVMWIFEGLNGKNHAYYVNTAAHDFLAMCSAAYMEKDTDVRRLSVSKRGLSGKFEIKLIIDDKKYHTGILVSC